MYSLKLSNYGMVYERGTRYLLREICNALEEPKKCIFKKMKHMSRYCKKSKKSLWHYEDTYDVIIKQ